MSISQVNTFGIARALDFSSSFFHMMYDGLYLCELLQKLHPLLVCHPFSFRYLIESIDIQPFWTTGGYAFTLTFPLPHLNSKEPSQQRVKRWGFSIDEVLKDPVGRDLFLRFLESEFSSENLR